MSFKSAALELYKARLLMQACFLSLLSARGVVKIWGILFNKDEPNMN